MRKFVASDTHLGHRLMERVRPFDTLSEHDETIIRNWNETVGEDDIVYHLGDVVMNRNMLHLAGRLNGRKRLVLGNHDMFGVDEYSIYFEKIMGVADIGWSVLTHVPVHEGELGRFGTNIHGHLHKHQVMKHHASLATQNIDLRYICVSMEQIDYRPVLLETVQKRFIERGVLK